MRVCDVCGKEFPISKHEMIHTISETRNLLGRVTKKLGNELSHFTAMKAEVDRMIFNIDSAYQSDAPKDI